MKKLFIIVSLVVCSLFAFSCKKENELGLVEEGKLIVATSSDYAPFEFVNLNKTGQDKFVGSDMEMARYIAKELDLELVIKPMAFDSILTALDSGKADLAISGFNYTNDRAAYAFSSCYLGQGDGGQVLVTLNTNSGAALADFNVSTCKVAAQSGALQSTLVSEQLPNADLVQIEDLTNALTLLKSGNFDAIAVAQSVAEAWLTTDKDLKMAASFVFEDSGYYVIASPEKKALLEAINPIIENDIAKVQENGKTMYEQWQEDAVALFESLGDKASEANPEEESGDL